jgi:type I restriction enzyme S subunit
VDFEPFADGGFIESELGKIPSGWRITKLENVVSLTSGYSYKGAELQPSNIAMATIKNFERNGGFKTEGFKEIVITGKIKPTQYAERFNILVAHTDLTQSADVIANAEMLMTTGLYERIVISLDLVKVQSCLPELSNFVLVSILRSPQFKNHALGYINGTTVLHLSKRAIPEYNIALPDDISILVKANDILEPIYRRIADNIEESARLATLRDTLLPRLLSGELSVAALSVK